MSKNNWLAVHNLKEKITSSEKKSATVLKDVEINIKTKLAVLWATVMFIYIYVDIFRFFQPGELQHILAGKVWVFDITQTWALSAMIMMTVPSLLVFLSLVLKAQVNRWVNIIMGALHIVIAIGNVIGETWAYYIFGGVVKAVLLVLVVWYAWKWPTQEV